MFSGLRSYVARHHVGLLALFFAIGGTAFAVDGSNPGQNTVGSEDIIGNEVRSDDIANGRIFNIDLADNAITGAKLQNGTLRGQKMNISADLYRTESELGLGTQLGDGTFRIDHSCDAGDVLLSGGPANVGSTSDMIESFPAGTNSWGARLDKNGGGDLFSVVALCLDDG